MQRVYELLLLMVFLAPGAVCAKESLDFKDLSPSALLHKAWGSFNNKDYHTAELYAQKVIHLYADKAQTMQKKLATYPMGKQNILKYWALNDVGTSLFIVGESLQNTGKKQEALNVFRQIIDQYSYAQCWDPHGWFWKPAYVAQDKLTLAAQGVDVDFGNYNSSFLVQQAWAASGHHQIKVVEVLVHKIEELYGAKARQMQLSLTSNTDVADKQKVFSHWALNDVGTALYILANTYHKLGRRKEADGFYERIINEYSYAQCWDPRGWFWKPAEAAAMKLKHDKMRQSLFGN